MKILEILLHWDSAAFQFINGSLSNPVFDALLPWFREKWFWMPLYLFIAAFVVLNYKKRGWVILLGLVLSAGVSDFSSSNLIKKNVQRIRPCHDPAMYEKIRLRVTCGGGYSFTSSHAANHFAAAVFLIGVLGGQKRWLRPVALAWASVIALSQVYVGVHYPGDILFGAVLGSAIGQLIVLGWRKWLD